MSDVTLSARRRAPCEFHTGRWPTPLHETAFLRGVSVYNFTAVGTEVALSVVRKSPFVSLTRVPRTPPIEAKGRHSRPRSPFSRVHP
jgi:hypothetical protein